MKAFGWKAVEIRKDNVNQWVDGFGDLPENLVRFALTLPWWQASF